MYIENGDVKGKRNGFSKKRDTVSKYDKFVLNVLVGGVSGCVAKTVLAPVEVVRVLVQTGSPLAKEGYSSVSRLGHSIIDLKKTRGFFGLFQGHTTALLRIFPYSGIKFATYETVRDILIKKEEDNVPIRRLLSGAVAGLASVTLCYPLELVHVRMVTTTVEHGKVGLLRIISDIKEEVLDLYSKDKYNKITRTAAVFKNFYRGYIPTVLGSIPYNGVGFYIYNAFKSTDYLYFSSPSSEYIPSCNFRYIVYGAISGGIALTFSYPIEVVRRTIQARTLDSFYVTGPSIKYNSENTVFKTVLRLYEKNGLRSFYSGLLLGYAKVIPTMAISFFVYELGKSLLNF